MNAPRFRRALPRIAVLSLALIVPAAHVLARGGSQGLHWGYQPPAGNPLTNLWLLTSPWAALSGWGIPHHDLEAPDLNMSGPSRSYGSTRTYGPTGTSLSGPVSTVQPSRPARVPYVAPVYPTPDKAYNTDRQFQPPYYETYNGYWHHGYWGGGQWGWERWDDELGLWSFPRWALPGLYFPSGYGRYRNPFASGKSGPAGSPQDYSVPIEPAEEHVAAPSSAIGDAKEKSAEEALEQARRDLIRSPEVTAGLKSFEAARAAFREKNFDVALRMADETLRQLPHDPALHEFRGLVLFARGEYGAAAATIYSVLSVSPGWDWTTLSGMYANKDEYTAQLRNLETYRKQHPESAEAAFLSAYHYVTCRHNESAIKQLRSAIKLLPDDDLAPHLLSLLSGADEIPAPVTTPTAEVYLPQKAPSVDAAPEIDPKKFVGTWRAQHGTDVRIELTLADDGKFVWVVTRVGKTRRYEGHHRIVGNQLELVGPRGTMLGFIKPRPTGGFEFRLLENDPPAAGLEFGP